MGRQSVVFSLYGTNPAYLRGAVENARLLPVVYPGWGMRVYCEEGMDTRELGEMGCEVVQLPYKSKGHSGMFWRFLAAWDPDLERIIVRDADSRLNVREAAAVEEWVRSGKDAHCLHDHPHHCRLPLQGGMWGVRVGCLPSRLLRDLEERSQRRQKRVADMKFLRDRVYPHVRGSLLRHSSVPVPWSSEMFPSHEPYEGFVGQQYE